MKPFYQDDYAVIYHGDCREILPSLGRFDHVITDPPYEDEAHTMGRRIKTFGGGGEYGETGTCVLDFEPITDETRSFVSAQFSRITNRWCIVFCQVEAVAAWRNALVFGGLSYRRTCAWIKRDAQPQLSGDRPGMGYESIVCAHAPGRSRWNGGGKRGVYETVRASTCEHRPSFHMTEKPMPLMRALIADFTNQGETILDAFSGSGTTLLAAKSMGRKSVGIEKNEAHCETAARRLSQQEYLPLNQPAERMKQGEMI